MEFIPDLKRISIWLIADRIGQNRVNFLKCKADGEGEKARSPAGMAAMAIGLLGK